MKTYGVDGLFLTQRVSGLQRYARELLWALDPLLAPGELELAVPAALSGLDYPAYRNICVVPCGGHTGFAWEQLDYPRYLKHSGRTGLCLCNVIPVFGFRGIAAVHDICYRARPDFFTTPRDRRSALWHRFQYRLIAQKADKIITVSQFSKGEITRAYRVPGGRVAVIPNAWQHLCRIMPDETIFDREPRLVRGGYCFTMANLLKNKNFPWVLRAAAAAPDQIFAIAGDGSLQTAAGELGLAKLPNVLYLGYVSDAEAKALMANCRAFLFPTLYEGFGIPPLEAIACGAPRVIVSDTPCMREVYGAHADYIDLARNRGDLSAVTPGHNAAGVLSRYSWARSAQLLAELLRA